MICMGLDRCAILLHGKVQPQRKAFFWIRIDSLKVVLSARYPTSGKISFQAKMLPLLPLLPLLLAHSARKSNKMDNPV